MAEVKSAVKEDFDWRKSTLFQFCNKADWDIFRDAVTLTGKPAGSVLWREDEASLSLVCVVGGGLESVKKTPEWGKPVIMARFTAGASVGESIFTDIGAAETCPHSTTLQVVEDSSLLILDEAAAVSLQKKAPATVARLVSGALCLQFMRLRQLNRRLATLF